METKLCHYLEVYYTRERFFSLILIILAVVDNLTHPTAHIQLINDNKTLLELFIRSWFVFAGIFGLLQNARTERIRVAVISTPYLYLGSFYLINYLETHVTALIIPAILAFSTGMWLLTLGAINELKQRICQRASELVDSLISESSNKVPRDT